MAAKKQASKARVLKTSVHVHEWAPIDEKNPEAGSYIARTEAFEAGQELPEWAQSQVGDHVFEDESSDDEQPEA